MLTFEVGNEFLHMSAHSSLGSGLVSGGDCLVYLEVVRPNGAASYRGMSHETGSLREEIMEGIRV